MGLFDIFKSKNNSNEGILDTLHCANGNEWTDGYKNKKPEELIKKYKDLDKQKFFNYLKKKPRYLKLSNQLEVNDGVSKINCSGDVKGHFVYPSYYLEQKVKGEKILVQGMRVIKNNITYNPNDGYKLTKGYSLEILNIDREDKKSYKPLKFYHVCLQYVDLDNEEYKFIKPLYSKITNINKENLYNHIMELYKGYHFGLGGTEKRKAYPINRYNSFFGFKEDL